MGARTPCLDHHLMNIDAAIRLRPHVFLSNAAYIIRLLQDGIDEIMDAEEEGEGAFIQLDQAGRFRRFTRGVGVFLLMLFLLLACVSTAAVILGLMVGAITSVLVSLGFVAAAGASAWFPPRLLYGIYGGLAGAGAALLPCTYQLATDMFPRISQ